MNRASVIVVITVVMTWFAVVRSYAPPEIPPMVPPSPILSVPAAVPHSSGVFPRSDSRDRTRDTDGDDEVSEAQDLYGNDVASAVATYKVDNAGSLYELHSPHTEVPRPGVPKT